MNNRVLVEWQVWGRNVSFFGQDVKRSDLKAFLSWLRDRGAVHIVVGGKEVA